MLLISGSIGACSSLSWIRAAHSGLCDQSQTRTWRTSRCPQRLTTMRATK
jgi:hypothetical protein